MRTATSRRGWTAVLVGAVLLSTALPGSDRPAAAGQPHSPRSAEVQVGGRYWSQPPKLLDTSAARAQGASHPTTGAPEREQPPSAPTRGTVTGRLVDRAGRPLAGVLVTGVRFSDLGEGIDFEEETPVVTRTGTDGRFRLPQLTERYLVRACDAGEEAVECTSDPEAKRFAPTYVGPDGTSSSWLTQTRMFRPAKGTRALGVIRARASAVLTGTFADGPHRSVRLLRGDGSTAQTARTDDDGRYRFEVAPGRYRVEVDRIENVRTVATVPGFRSRVLRLGTGRATRLDLASTGAATLEGRVTAHGEPVAEQFVAITDDRGRFAAGVVTDADGRYGLDALKPGRYTLSTPAAATTFVPVSRSFTLDARTPTRADLELRDGARIVLAPTDVGSPAPGADVVVELRDATGAITKAAGASPGDVVSFSGLAPGRYQVVARRSADDGSGEVVTELPWAERVVQVGGTRTVDLGAVALDRATLNLSGTLPRGSRIRITPLPDVPYLRPDFVEGTGVTGLSASWTTDAEPSGRYLARGLVPGRYLVAVTAQYLQPNDGPTVYRGDVAVTHRWLTVTATTTTASFTAPRGGRVTGRFRHAGTHRPAIAPFAYQVRDGGDQARLLPLVSRPQTYRSGFTVDRLHAGRGHGTVVDLQQVLDLADAQGEELPTNLTDSASTEPGTPYWFTATPGRFRIRYGRTTDLGLVDLHVRG
ncbi:MSCRAMM family protein [Microlunatus flavus]|uniref:alpha-amylase n=1 Tax=Microlunatus flavus TaxID=1036181 RepID=A0A1H9JH79_9ACTN|nr:carboxypeptidase-like regulatory domain-containing protein [Microlunatus flavus]SEQ86170.1 Carboxypeptidase regulatory-like domain-containing protein [Microlunatus flavus]